MTATRLAHGLLAGGLLLIAGTLAYTFVPVQIGIGFAVLGWVILGFTEGRWRYRRHLFFVPLLFYLGWNFLSAALSVRPLHTLYAVVNNEWALLILLMMYWNLDRLRDLNRLVYTLLLTSAPAMVFAVWQIFYGGRLHRTPPLSPMGRFYRAVGFHGFYLTFAGFALAVFFLAGAHFLLRRERVRWWFAGLAALSLAAMIGTFARSIWLSLAAAVPVAGFVRGRKTGLIVSGAGVVLALVGLYGSSAIRDRAASILDLSQNETRLNLWKTAEHIARDHPLLGIGEDNWVCFFPRYRVPGNYDVAMHPHNDYLNVLVNSGVPGLISFLALWVLALREAWRGCRPLRDDRARATALGAGLALLGLLIGGFFQNYYGTFMNCLEWWLLVGLIFAAGKAEAGGGVTGLPT